MSKARLPDFVEKQLVKGEEVMASWSMKSFLTTYLFVATNRRGIIYISGPLRKEFTDFTWDLTSSIRGVKARPLECLVMGLISFLPSLIVLLSWLLYPTMVPTGFPSIVMLAVYGLILLPAAAIADYASKKYEVMAGAAIFIGLVLPIPITVLIYTLVSAFSMLFLSLILCLVYGGVSLALFLFGIDMMAFYVVGMPRPIRLPTFIVRVIVAARGGRTL